MSRNTPEPRGISTSRPGSDPATLKPARSSNYSAIDLGEEGPSFSPLPPLPSSGETLGGFKIIETRSRSVRATVYRAHQVSRDREIALKVLDPRLALDAGEVARFREETRIADQLAHPGLLPSCGGGFDGIFHYRAMKLVHGPTLAEFLHGALGHRGELFYREASSLFAGLAHAVAGLHAQGIVHRDISPDNIFLLPGDRLLLGGLGRARDFRSEPRSPLPEGGPHPGGNPAYLAPERFLEDANHCDLRSDVYSLGLCFYELLTGTMPFEETGQEELLRSKLHRRPPSPRQVAPNVPLSLEAVIRQAMDIHLALRYQNAADMARDLDRFVEMHRPSARQHPSPGGYDDGPEGQQDHDDPDGELIRA